MICIANVKSDLSPHTYPVDLLCKKKQYKVHNLRRQKVIKLKSLNILSLIQAHESLNPDSFTSFLKYHGIGIKPAELEDLESIVNLLYNHTNTMEIFNSFYVGYKIPQIGKEFDLLRFGEQYVVNVELKRNSTEEKIQKQLIRNKYYLSYTGKKIYNISYVSDTETIYLLKEDKSLTTIDIDHLEKLLAFQKLEQKDNIDALFNPSDYLVSPFNSTDKFLSDLYFLTHQQEDIKTQIINSLLPAKKINFISVIGGAGTGKTLLVYDIAKILMQKGLRTLVIHCGNLNSGQNKLIKSGWEIIKIKDYKLHDLSDYDLVIIDEVQRIYPTQLNKIIDSIVTNNSCCIFSYDKLQTLAKIEESRDIDAKINNLNPIHTYKLSEKIRTNKEIANFIRMLFNHNRNLESSKNGNIEINYFQNIQDAKNYLTSLDSDEWEVLRFTPSQYDKEHHEKYSHTLSKTSHEVIGQEFDNVAVTIDSYFTYDENGKLIYQGKAYYYTLKMLFQNITRARKRLNLVIIDNEELLNRCLSILK